MLVIRAESPDHAESKNAINILMPLINLLLPQSIHSWASKKILKVIADILYDLYWYANELLVCRVRGNFNKSLIDISLEKDLQQIDSGVENQWLRPFKYEF